VDGVVRLDGAASPVIPITRNERMIGVVLPDGAGYRWQPIRDVDHLVTVATVTAGAVAVAGLVGAAFRRPRVQRITMGPGGWVSFRGTATAPSLHRSPRPWWAVLLRARPLDQSR
jgi:signal transduction protein with GAF and PtsI domain